MLRRVVSRVGPWPEQSYLVRWLAGGISMPGVTGVSEKPYGESTDESPSRAGRSRRRERPLNDEFNARISKRLRDNEGAIQYLTNLGLTLNTIDGFRLGLSPPYSSKKLGAEVANALMFPLRNREGKFYNKYGYYNIPDVTLNPPGDVG
jgi:hypothetical protein